MINRRKVQIGTNLRTQAKARAKHVTVVPREFGPKIVYGASSKNPLIKQPVVPAPVPVEPTKPLPVAVKELIDVEEKQLEDFAEKAGAGKGTVKIQWEPVNEKH